MTRRDEIERDLGAAASRFLEARGWYERRHLRIRIRRLFAERDALTPAEAAREVA
jgi:hypothetical protein